MKTVIVAGALANKYRNGGEAWVRLNWTLGFERLGWETYFVEQLPSRLCVDDRGLPVAAKDSKNVEFFERVTRAFGLAERAALILDDGPETVGLSYDALLAVAARADLLVNISGNLTDENVFRRVACTALVDLDPGYTQFWHHAETPGGLLRRHDYYFTVGENIGAPDCPIPTCGIRWLPTRQPVVLDLWPVAPPVSFKRFTTVASWRGAFGPVEHHGRRYGPKAHQFRRFRDLPSRRPYEFELALDIHSADEGDRRAMREAGWRIVRPTEVAGTPEAFRHYVRQSSGEFSVAQGTYVDTNSGWFSDRTAYYLASGKPALVQHTGFSQRLPVGEGLIPFTTLDEAARGADEIVANYQFHCRAARRVAQECFAAETVLSEFLSRMDLNA